MKTETSKELLIANAIKRILRPLIKLMLSHNLTYTLIIDVIKALFVEVAEQEFSQEGKRLTDARISLMSGVHRKDVKRLRELQPAVEDVMPANVSLGSQIIAQWNANKMYLDENDVPKPLARFSSNSSEASFDTLVRSISTDIHPRAVLDEWLRLGVATLDEHNDVHLTSDAFVTQEGFEEKVYYLGHNLHDHSKAAVENVLNDGQLAAKSPYFERCVHYDGLTIQSIHDIDALTQKLGMKHLRDINKFADDCAQKDANNVEANMRMTYGIYFYHEPIESVETVNQQSAT